MRGSSIKAAIQTAVEEEIRKSERKPGKRLKFPLLPSREPGTLNLTKAEIDELNA